MKMIIVIETNQIKCQLMEITTVLFRIMDFHEEKVKSTQNMGISVIISILPFWDLIQNAPFSEYQTDTDTERCGHIIKREICRH